MLKSLLIFLALFFLCDCAHHYGIYHTVSSGENLYRIAKTYDLNAQELAEINDIEDPTRIRVGERIFIPGAKQPLSVAGISPTEKNQQPAIPVQTFRGPYMWPVKGRISSRYGARNGTIHDGIDVAAPKGTPIRAASSGRVIYSDHKLRGYGNMIIIKHQGVFSTVYAHNAVNLVKRNDFVEKGEIIGRVGATGRASGPHLHFEIRKGRKAVNPLFYLPKT